MYCTNSGRQFVDYKVYVGDIRYAAIKEEDIEAFEEQLNSLIETIEEDGYMIVGISYKHDDVYCSAIIEYVANDKVYYERKEEDTDG